jgi:hypothetical protein
LEPLFALAEILLGLAALGDIAFIDDDGLQDWVLEVIAGGAFHPAPGVVRVPKAVAGGDGCAWVLGQFLEHGVDVLLIIGMDEVAGLATDEIVR